MYKILHVIMEQEEVSLMYLFRLKKEKFLDSLDRMEPEKQPQSGI